VKHLLLSFLLTLSLFCQTLSWRGGYDKAHAEARAQHKVLMVLVVKARDPLSQKIIQTVFMHQPYLETLNVKTVPVIVTFDQCAYPIELYYTTTFPTLFLVDPQTELLKHAPLYGTEITASRIHQITTSLSSSRI
jgi:hypothetical protein